MLLLVYIQYKEFYIMILGICGLFLVYYYM